MPFGYNLIMILTVIFSILYLNFLDFQEYFKAKLIYFNQFKSILFKTKKEA
jgi:hypothetical protein